MENFTFRLFFIVILFISCSQNDETPTPDIAEEESEMEVVEIPELILKTVSRNVVTTDNPPRVASFDIEGRIVTLENYGDISEFFRDENGNVLYYNTPNPQYVYENNIWTKTMSSTDTGATETLVTYDNNNITLQGRDLFDDEDFYFRNVYTFEDDSYSKIISTETIDNSSGQILSRTTYEYTGNNTTRVFTERIDQSTGELTPRKDQIFYYDQKINPYKKGLPQNIGLHLNLQFLELGDFRQITYLSQNNVTQVDVTDFFNESQGSIFYEYEYNDLDYPTTRMQINGETLRAESTFEYH